jgi:hypothetical protein
MNLFTLLSFEQATLAMHIYSAYSIFFILKSCVKDIKDIDNNLFQVISNQSH